MVLENKNRETAKRYIKRHCKIREDKDALQEIGNRNLTDRSQRFFLRGHLYKGLYCGHKGKEYARKEVLGQVFGLDV